MKRLERILNEAAGSGDYPPEKVYFSVYRVDHNQATEVWKSPTADAARSLVKMLQGHQFLDYGHGPVRPELFIKDQFGNKVVA